MAETADYFDTKLLRRAPGVYIEEVTPDQASMFRTGVPVFVGFARQNRQADVKDKGTKFFRLTRWEHFAQHVRHTISKGFLADAVCGFFENGGERCVVVPLWVSGDIQSPAALQEQLRDVFRTDENGRRGFLEDLEDTDLVCVPDIMMEGIGSDQNDVFELQQQVLKYCEDLGDRFAILDVWPTTDIELAIQHWRELLPTEGALYYPWIKNRTGNWVPPCGHVAGIYARTDAQVGVHKAPANEIVEGATDLAMQLTDEEQSRLNDVGVNCLRSFPGRGIRVWGARTLNGLPSWRYVNVRRLFLTLIRWIEHNMHDLVFEPNSPLLWERVRRRLGSYCNELFQRGALKGREPKEAFFVKCDAETNPLMVREAGQLICEVGLAPLTPAEFIIVRITQSAAGAAVSGPVGA